MKGEFYKMDFRAWNVGTIDLTLEQEAAYLRLCHAMYDARGPIPNSIRLLMGIFRCGNVKAAALVRHLVVTGKIEETEDGLLTNRRVTAELVGRDSLSSERSVAGKRGGTASGVARKKANEINGGAEASASSKRTREEESREEERRVEEEKKGSAEPDTTVLPPAPWDIDLAKPEPAPPAKVYAFEEGIVRLTQPDFDRWRSRYPNINLESRLASMVEWAETLQKEGKNWFRVFPARLAKLEEEARSKNEGHRVAAEALARKAARYVPGEAAV